MQLGSVRLMVLHGVLRPLFRMGELQLANSLSQYIEPGGYCLVVENIRPGNSQYIEESRIIKMFDDQGLVLEKVHTVRRARWWVLYLIRYGLIPLSWLPGIADWELKSLSRIKRHSRLMYYNKLFIFRRC